MRTIKIGRKLPTEESATEGWLCRCRERSFHPASTSGPREGTAHPSGLSATDNTKSPRAHGPEHEREAQAALGAYLIRKAEKPPDQPQSPDVLTVDQALTYYGNEEGMSVSAPLTLAFSIDRLSEFFGTLPVSSIKGNTCRRYLTQRQKPRKIKGRTVTAGASTVRRELGVLQAALNHCETEGSLVTAPRVWLPPAPPARDRWLTRDEAARLLWAVRRTPHLARFILISLYTGTRSGAVKKLQWIPNTEGGHVDLEAGLLYRKSAMSKATKKRQTPVRIPVQLLAHMRRWQRKGGRYLVEFHGGEVKSIKTGWAAAIRRSGIAPTHPHDLRHTCAIWLMQQGADKWEAAGFLGMSAAILEEVYGHHHPDHQGSAARAVEKRRRDVSGGETGGRG